MIEEKLREKMMKRTSKLIARKMGQQSKRRATTCVKVRERGYKAAKVHLSENVILCFLIERICVAAYDAGKWRKGRTIKWNVDLLGFLLDEFAPQSSEIINAAECDENRDIPWTRSLFWLTAGVILEQHTFASQAPTLMCLNNSKGWG